MVNGNFVLACRRGIVGGTDFGAMGCVRRVAVGPVRAQLDARAIVLLTNIGVTASGELLNCNVYDVATHAAVELGADKLLVVTDSDVARLRLPNYLPLDDAERRIAEASQRREHKGEGGWRKEEEEEEEEAEAEDRAKGEDGHGDREGAEKGGERRVEGGGGTVHSGEPVGSGRAERERTLSSVCKGGSGKPRGQRSNENAMASTNNDGGELGGGSALGDDGLEPRSRTASLHAPSPSSSSPHASLRPVGRLGSGSLASLPLRRPGRRELAVDLDEWLALGYPPAVLAAVFALRCGVTRAHLVDSRVAARGGLLLEMYTRDSIAGVCMIAGDMYQGMRRARPSDARGVARLLGHLDAQGGRNQGGGGEGGDGEEGDGSTRSSPSSPETSQAPQTSQTPQLAARASPPAPSSSPASSPSMRRFRPERLADRLADVTVLEREGRVLGAAAVCNVGPARDGARCSELALLVVDKRYRRAGMGDALLDYVEQDAKFQGYARLAAVQTGSEGFYEWLVARGFEPVPRADAREGLLPRGWVDSLPPVAKIYVKRLEQRGQPAPAGTRIGF